MSSPNWVMSEASYRSAAARSCWPSTVEYISIDLFTDTGVSIFDGVELPDSSAIFETDLTQNSLFRIGFSVAETGKLFEFTSGFSDIRPGREDHLFVDGFERGGP